MILNQIYSKDKNLWNEIFLKKNLNKDFYEKSYVRGSLIDSRQTQILDNYNSFFSFSSRSFFKIYNQNLYKKLDGLSLSTNTFFYKNILNNNLRFKFFLINSSPQRKFVNSFYNSLKSLEVSSIKFNSLLILRAVKGGFLCYSRNISGFLPRSHGRCFTAKVLVSLVNSQQSLLNKISECYFLIFQKNNFLFSTVIRFKFILGRVGLYIPKIKKNKFSTAFLKRKKFFFNDYNFVFLSGRKIQKNKILKSINILPAKNKNFKILNLSNAKAKKISKK